MASLPRLILNQAKTLKNLVYHRLYISAQSEKSIVDQFHMLYYDTQNFGGTWGATTWLGVPVSKVPLDLWVYQEIIHELKPDLIIESGTSYGGSALFMASVCDLLGKGRIVSIDIEAKSPRPTHPRIQYFLGSSTSEQIVEQVKGLIGDQDKVMVILDSDHRKEHVLDELRIYSALVTQGSYLIVEDTNVNGHPIAPEHGPGPLEAIEEFLVDNTDFVVDRSREKFYLTFNPRGYLRRVR